MGRGVPPACSKPDPVAIRLAAKKTPCPNLEINTEFNRSAYNGDTLKQVPKFRSSQVPGTSSSQFSSSGNLKFRNFNIKTLFAKIVFGRKNNLVPIINFKCRRLKLILFIFCF